MIPFPPRAIRHAGGSVLSALLGPTNTGKTYRAVERMLHYGAGMIGLPLRLLAREVYDKLVLKVGKQHVALLTGEERIEPLDVRFWVCTVESMPLDKKTPIVIVDEIQLALHAKRGHVFTDRILNARGTIETWFLGSDIMGDVLKRLVPTATHYRFERFSKLHYTATKRLEVLPPRSAVIAFSIGHLYSLAERIRARTGGVAIVLGALSPKARNAQVELFESGQVNHIVSTDAIGMGLNLDVRAVYFAALHKFDGQQLRALEPWELGQIAGRAGRYRKPGYFGMLQDSSEGLRDWLIESIENQHFAQAHRVYYRNSDLCFDSIVDFQHSLRDMPKTRLFQPAWNLPDERAFQGLIQEADIREKASSREGLQLLWQVSQIPDYRQDSDSDHHQFLAYVYRQLVSTQGVIASDWLRRRLKRLNRIEGRIETLLQKIAYIRTWAYIAYREHWVENPIHWRSEIADIEDRLSTTLHEQLRQNFVDDAARAKSDFIEPQGVHQKGNCALSDRGLLGEIKHLCFVPTSWALQIYGNKNLRRSVRAIVSSVVDNLRTEVASEELELFSLKSSWIYWNEHRIARISKGRTAFSPKVSIMPMDLVQEPLRGKVFRKAQMWWNECLRMLSEELDPPTESPHLSALFFELKQSLGVVSRDKINNLWSKLSREERRVLKNREIVLGRKSLYSKRIFQPHLWSTCMAIVAYQKQVSVDKLTSSVLWTEADLTKSNLGYQKVGSYWMRIDLWDRVVQEHFRDPSSLRPISWLKCDEDIWIALKEHLPVKSAQAKARRRKKNRRHRKRKQTSKKT